MSNNNRSEIYKSSLDLAQTNDVRTIAFQFIQPASKVLDVGCACGDFGALIQSQHECEIHGMDTDAGSIDIAAATRAYASIAQVDLNNFNCEMYAHLHGIFDVIAMLDVLEHLNNPLAVLIAFRKFLKPGGLFVISLPNVAHGSIKLKLIDDNFAYTATGILDETHVRFFTHRSIANLATEAGLQILKVVPKVIDFTAENSGQPMIVRGYVAKNPHSYVFNYVFGARLAQADASLLRWNSDRMGYLDWKTNIGSMRRLWLMAFKNIVLPHGSMRHHLAKRIFSAACKK